MRRRWSTAAVAWHRFTRITLPLLSPSLFFVIVTSIISSFQVFGPGIHHDRRRAGTRTTTLVMYIYRSGFEN